MTASRPHSLHTLAATLTSSPPPPPPKAPSSHSHHQNGSRRRSDSILSREGLLTDQDAEQADVTAAMLASGIRRPQHEGQASMLSSVANLLNTIVGTGMLATPHAISYVGSLPGVLLILLCATTAFLGLFLLMECARTLGGRSHSFFSVAMTTMPRGARIFDLAIALKCYGVSISYLIICGQLMPQVVTSFAKATHHKGTDVLPPVLLDRNFWIFVFMLVLTPLCFLRRLDSLRHTSYLSGLAVIYLIFIVLHYSLPSSHAKLPPKGAVHLINVDMHHFLSTFPVFVFAFTCAQNCLPVYNELRATDARDHLARARRAVGSSIGLAAAIYLVVGLLGYLSFGDRVGDNIIAMYPSTSLFVCFGRVAIVVLVLLSYPLQLHPCRAALDKVLTWDTRRGLPVRPSAQVPGRNAPPGMRYRDEEDGTVEAEDQDGLETTQRAQENGIASNGRGAPGDGGKVHNGSGAGVQLDEEDEGSPWWKPKPGKAPGPDAAAAMQERAQEVPLGRWCALTALILTTTFCVSLLVDDLSVVLGFVGSIGSTTISFILPGVLYASLHRRGGGDDDDGDEEEEAGERRARGTTDARFDGGEERRAVVGSEAWREEKKRRSRTRAAMALATYGAVVLVISLGANIAKLLHRAQAPSPTMANVTSTPPHALPTSSASITDAAFLGLV